MRTDTEASVKLRWEVRTTSVYEAEVPVDQIPDALIWHGDGNEWSVITGDVDHHSVSDLLEALDGAGSATEQSLTVDGYTILDDVELIPPIMVAAPPVRVGPTSVDVAEYIETLEGESEMLTPYNADEVIDLADESRKERA